MTLRARQVLRGAIIALAVIALCGALLVALLSLASYPFRREWAEQDRKLDSLRARRASKDMIAAELGTNYRYYEKSAENWKHLQSFLRMPDINRRIGTAEPVMYYTTANVMSWIALDSECRITNYCLCKQ